MTLDTHCHGKDHDFLMASHHWKQFQRGNCLSEFTHPSEGSAIPPARTPAPGRLCTAGVSGTAQKSPAQGFLNILSIPALSEREHGHSPPNWGVCCHSQPPHHDPRVSHLGWKRHLRPLSPTMCQLDPSMYFLQRHLFHWEHSFYFPVFIIFPAFISQYSGRNCPLRTPLCLPDPAKFLGRCSAATRLWHSPALCSCPAGSTALLIPEPALQPNSLGAPNFRGTHLKHHTWATPSQALGALPGNQPGPSTKAWEQPHDRGAQSTPLSNLTAPPETPDSPQTRAETQQNHARGLGMQELQLLRVLGQELVSCASSAPHPAQKELSKTDSLQSFPFAPGITEPKLPEAP